MCLILDLLVVVMVTLLVMQNYSCLLFGKN